MLERLITKFQKKTTRRNNPTKRIVFWIPPFVSKMATLSPPSYHRRRSSSHGAKLSALVGLQYLKKLRRLHEAEAMVDLTMSQFFRCYDEVDTERIRHPEKLADPVIIPHHNTSSENSRKSSSSSTGGLIFSDDESELPCCLWTSPRARARMEREKEEKLRQQETEARKREEQRKRRLLVHVTKRRPPVKIEVNNPQSPSKNPSPTRHIERQTGQSAHSILPVIHREQASTSKIKTNKATASNLKLPHIRNDQSRMSAIPEIKVNKLPPWLPPGLKQPSKEQVHRQENNLQFGLLSSYMHQRSERMKVLAAREPPKRSSYQWPSKLDAGLLNVTSEHKDSKSSHASTFGSRRKSASQQSASQSHSGIMRAANRRLDKRGRQRWYFTSSPTPLRVYLHYQEQKPEKYIEHILDDDGKPFLPISKQGILKGMVYNKQTKSIHPPLPASGRFFKSILRECAYSSSSKRASGGTWRGLQKRLSSRLSSRATSQRSKVKDPRLAGIALQVLRKSAK